MAKKGGKKKSGNKRKSQQTKGATQPATALAHESADLDTSDQLTNVSTSNIEESDVHSEEKVTAEAEIESNFVEETEIALPVIEDAVKSTVIEIEADQPKETSVEPISHIDNDRTAFESGNIAETIEPILASLDDIVEVSQYPNIEEQVNIQTEIEEKTEDNALDVSDDVDNPIESGEPDLSFLDNGNADKMPWEMQNVQEQLDIQPEIEQNTSTLNDDGSAQYDESQSIENALTHEEDWISESHEVPTFLSSNKTKTSESAIKYDNGDITATEDKIITGTENSGVLEKTEDFISNDDDSFFNNLSAGLQTDREVEYEPKEETEETHNAIVEAAAETAFDDDSLLKTIDDSVDNGDDSFFNHLSAEIQNNKEPQSVIKEGTSDVDLLMDGKETTVTEAHNDAEEQPVIENSNSLEITEDFVNDDDSFFNQLSGEIQSQQVHQSEQQEEAETVNKFEFLEDEEDDILDDIMDDDFLEEDEEEADEYNTTQGNSSVIFSPSPEKKNPYQPDIRYQPPSNYQPARVDSPTIFSRNTSLGINSVLNSKSSEDYNSMAANIHNKLEEQKKKSDAYDFPADLLSKHNKKLPTATQNVYTKIENSLKTQRSISNIMTPPKIGANLSSIPQPNAPNAQKPVNSSDSTAKPNSFFAELPPSTNKLNSPKPAHLKNPYEVIEKSPVSSNATLTSNVGASAPPSQARKNPYAPQKTPASNQNTKNVSSIYAKPTNPYAVPEKNTPLKQISSPTEQFQHPPSFKKSSVNRKSNPYAPAEVGGHIRQISSEPKPVDINPNLVSIPLASQPQINQFGQQQNDQSSSVGEMLASPTNQYLQPPQGLNQSFAFPASGNKYAPNNQPQHSSVRISTRVGKPSISSINEVYGSNIVTSNATSTGYKKKSILPPGTNNKGKHKGSNSVSVAPAPVVINPENLNRRQWPLFDFSAEKFVSMIPMTTGYGNVSCNFQINDFNAVLKDSNLIGTFPGPLNKSKTKRKDILKWIDEKVSLFEKSDDAEFFMNEAQLLWSVLKVMLEQINNKGDFTQNKDYISALLNLLNPSLGEVAANGKGELFDIVSVRNIAMTINSTSQPTAHRVDVHILSSIHDLLEKGEKGSALELALKHGDWTMTFLVAHIISPLAFNEILKLYTTINYGNNNLTSDLNFFLQSTAEEGLNNSLIGRESWLADNFKTVLPFILKNSTNLSESLAKIGESLLKAGYRIYGKLALILSGKPLVPICIEMLPTSIDDILIDEIYEYLLLSSGNMPSQFINGLPHMVPVKIRHSGCLADFGFVTEAKKYCASTQSDISSKQLFVEPSTTLAQQHLSDRLSQLGSSWLGGKLSKPQLDRVWTTLDKSFNKFVSGEENIERKGDDGIFSKFVSPAVSRTGSVLDLSQVHASMEQTTPMIPTINSMTNVSSSYGAHSRKPISLLSTPNAVTSANAHFTNTAVGPSIGHFNSSPSQTKYQPFNAPPAAQYAPPETKKNKYAPPAFTTPNIGSNENSNGFESNLIVPPPAPAFAEKPFNSPPANNRHYQANKFQSADIPSALPPPVVQEINRLPPPAAVLTAHAPAMVSSPSPSPSPSKVKLNLHASTQNNSDSTTSCFPPIKSQAGNSAYGIVVSETDNVAEKEVQSNVKATEFNPSDEGHHPNKQFVTEVDEVVKGYDIQDVDDVAESSHFREENLYSSEDKIQPHLVNNGQQVSAQGLEESYEEDLEDEVEEDSYKKDVPVEIEERYISKTHIEKQLVLDMGTSILDTQPAISEAGNQLYSSEYSREPDVLIKPKVESPKEPAESESIPSATSSSNALSDIASANSSALPPVVKAPINRYAPGTNKQARKTSNVYANPYAPKASVTRTTKSAYAPKEPLDQISSTDDPLAAMGITGDISSMDMFTATGYSIPPPPPPPPADETLNQQEQVPIKQEETISEIKEEVDLSFNGTPIPMLHYPVGKANHLTSMFEPPSASLVSPDLDVQRGKSPMYAITEERKFYAEDTGEYYDDIIDDDDDNNDDGAEAAERARLEEELRRKEQEEIERKKRIEEEEKKKQEIADKPSGSWFGSIFGGGNKKEQKTVYKAKLGEENSFYYDENLKRWINKKASVEEQLEGSKPPPPPPIKKIDTSTASSTSSFSPPPPSAGPPKSVPIGGSFSAPPRPQSSTLKSDSIDDLLNRPPATTRKAKRGPRRGYVDVMAQK